MAETITEMGNGPIESVESLPDSVPKVIFDPDLGNYFDDVDFDYGTYVDYLRQKGFDDEEISGLNVFITDKPARPETEEEDPSRFSAGSYDGDTNTVTVRLIDRKQNPRRTLDINATNVHETEHANNRRLDIKKFKPRSAVPSAIGNIAAAGVMLVSAKVAMQNGLDPTQLTFQKSGKRTNIPELAAESVKALTMLRLFNSNRLDHLLYRLTPDEISARRAAKVGMRDESLANIISIKSKTRPEQTES